MPARTVVFDSCELPTDAGGFVRRACPSCARHFKVPARGESAAMLAVSHLVRHENAAELPAERARHCPYCGLVAGESAFSTEAQRRWLESNARDLDVGVQRERLRIVEGLVALEAKSFLATAAERPREPDDMVFAPQYCCGENVKLKSSWSDAWFCPRCGLRQGPGAVV